MRDVTRKTWGVALVAVLGTVGCIAGRSPATRHYVLVPVIDAPSSGNADPAVSFVVGVGPVSLPAYLDRPQMVMRRTADAIEIREFDRWGESLRDGTTRVVAVDLARLLPDSRVVAFPWRSTEDVRYQVVLDIGQMDGPPTGSVALEARWRVLDRSGREVAGRVSRMSESTGDGTTAGAMSRALGALSHEIAEELKAAGTTLP